MQYAHPGHDRIARESMELRQREEELRERWKEMGFQLPQVSANSVFCERMLIVTKIASLLISIRVSPNSTWLVTSRLDSTRATYSPCILT